MVQKNTQSTPLYYFNDKENYIHQECFRHLFKFTDIQDSQNIPSFHEVIKKSLFSVDRLALPMN